MSTPSPAPDPTLPARPHRFRAWLYRRLPRLALLSNMSIGHKLTLGFSLLVGLLFLVITLASLGGQRATGRIDQVEQVRAPVALAASNAQANLLRMLASARGYLALGDQRFRDEYEQHRAAFARDLVRLQGLEGEMNPTNQARLQELEQLFIEWTGEAGPLFDLRDDQLAREPAYRLLATDGVRSGGQAIIDAERLITAQSIRQPTGENLKLLKDMADFQISLAGMLSGLRNYVTTQNRIYRFEFEANLTRNENVWQELQREEARGLLDPNQEELMAAIAENRSAFLLLPAELFAIVEGDEARLDLYRFRTQIVPQTEAMLETLTAMTVDQQTLLAQDLNDGRTALAQATRQTLIFGLLALVVAVALSLLLRENIAGPVQRLTLVADRIREGDLDVRAEVESNDEVGILAYTFNRMTGQLQETLRQVRQEKQRADALLNVVIPIGVDLSAEQDFNRLLEKMLSEAQQFCRAEAGTLYLRTEADELRFVLVRNEVLGVNISAAAAEEMPYAPLPLYDEAGRPNEENVAAYVALNGQTLNLPDVYAPAQIRFTGPAVFDERTGYKAESMLTIPLQNSEQTVLGVLQLINARDPQTNAIIQFDNNLQQMMESFSSLAAAALEAYIREQALRREIQQLRIEIDEVKLQQQVSETVETDFFQDLQAKARDIRRRRRAREEQET